MGSLSAEAATPLRYRDCVEHQNLLTCDGHQLAADLCRVAPSWERPGQERAALGAVVICHPHPLYGGNRFSIVVETIFSALPHCGFHTLRFDFRADHDNGRGERNDVIAAINALKEQFPSTDIHLIGYSFGAIVAMTTPDDRITSIVAIAPPLGLASEPITEPGYPTLILSPEHDQFCNPDQARRATLGWLHHEVAPIPMADHSLSGQTASLMPAITAWLG
jgi:alpha/beta superfamily hydrolase